MLELGARMAFGEKIGYLLHLERAFERDRKIELATKEKHPVQTCILFCDAFDLIAEFQDNLDLLRQRFQRLNDAASFRGGKISHPAEEQTKKGRITSCEVKDFVAATPISGPACI